MALDNEFKGTTKQALASLGEYVREFKDDFKVYRETNDKDHRDIFVAFGEMKGRRVPIKYLIGLAVSIITSATAIIIAVINA